MLRAFRTGALTPGDVEVALAHIPHLTDTTFMSSANDGRRYSEEEFALVLRMASELEESSDQALDRSQTSVVQRGGLTLSQMREIAGEVGIDPDRVSRAAALLPVGEETLGIRLLGGSPRQRLEQVVSGEVPSKDLARIVEVARRTLGVQGESREVLGGVEWKGDNNVTGFSVSATPREGNTTIQASTNRTESMMGIYGGVGMGVLGGVALTMAKLVFGESDAGIVAALLTGIPPAFLAARTLWKRSTEKWRGRTLDLMDSMVREAEAAIPTDGEDPSPPGSETGLTSDVERPSP